MNSQLKINVELFNFNNRTFIIDIPKKEEEEEEEIDKKENETFDLIISSIIDYTREKYGNYMNKGMDINVEIIPYDDAFRFTKDDEDKFKLRYGKKINIFSPLGKLNNQIRNYSLKYQAIDDIYSVLKPNEIELEKNKTLKNERESLALKFKKAILEKNNTIEMTFKEYSMIHTSKSRDKSKPKRVIKKSNQLIMTIDEENNDDDDMEKKATSIFDLDEEFLFDQSL